MSPFYLVHRQSVQSANMLAAPIYYRSSVYFLMGFLVFVFAVYCAEHNLLNQHVDLHPVYVTGEVVLSLSISARC